MENRKAEEKNRNVSLSLKSECAGQNEDRKNLVDTARGLKKADLVLKNSRIVSVFTNQIISGDIAICKDRIAGIGSYQGEKEIDLHNRIVVPGLIDAHFHIESTMATPSALSPVLLEHGVCTVIADPHEIVNAAGTGGLDFMLEDAAKADLDYFFMIPSSVPSCDFEINGAGQFTADQMIPYAGREDVLGLAEVMRMKDVLESDPAMAEKFSLFSDKRIDGHAPGLSENDLQAYRAAGVMNDHEASSAKEAIERLQAGFQLLIRQGSGAKNLNDILPGLLEEQIPFDHCSFCTDDKHIEDIVSEGTIDNEIREAIELGCSPFDAIRMATINTAAHFGLKDRGAIAPGYLADLVIVNSLEEFSIDSVIKSGKPVISSENSLKESAVIPESLLNSVHLPDLDSDDLNLNYGTQDIIEILPDQLLTLKKTASLSEENYPSREYNLLAAVERYGKTGEYACCALSGYGIRNGAIAMSYAHDSHNAIAVSDNKEDLILSLQTLQKIQGGIVLIENGQVFDALNMEAAGLMSAASAELTAQRVHRMKEKAQEMGTAPGVDPFANLSFLSLPVIPEVRLCPQGLYDTVQERFIND